MLMPSDGFEHDLLLKQLSREAVELAPRLFALYRIREWDSDRSGSIGWGIDFGNDEGAIFGYRGESSTWHSDSAEQLLRTHGILGDAYLRWIPGEEVRV